MSFSLKPFVHLRVRNKRDRKRTSPPTQLCTRAHAPSALAPGQSACTGGVRDFSVELDDGRRIAAVAHDSMKERYDGDLMGKRMPLHGAIVHGIFVVNRHHTRCASKTRDKAECYLGSTLVTYGSEMEARR